MNLLAPFQWILICVSASLVFLAGGLGVGYWYKAGDCKKDILVANAEVKVHKAEDDANTKVLGGQRKTERKADAASIGPLKDKVTLDAKTLPVALLNCRLDPDRLRDTQNLIRAANDSLGMHGAAGAAAGADRRRNAGSVELDREYGAAVFGDREKPAMPDRVGEPGASK